MTATPMLILLAGLLVASLCGLLFWNRKDLLTANEVPEKTPIEKNRHDHRDHNYFCDLDGVKVHYVTYGDGPDIVLLHGLGANIYCWRFLIPELSKNFRVWALDLPGFGKSDAPRDMNYNVQTQSSLVSLFLEKQNLKSITIAGNSLGGAIAAEVTVNRTDLVKNLILINSAHDPRIMKFSLKPLRRFIPYLAPLMTDQGVSLYMRQLYGANFEVTKEDVAAYTAPYRNKNLDRHFAFYNSFESLKVAGLLDRMKTIVAPVLIVWGAHDKITPVKYGRELHKILSHSKIAIHPTAGHHPQEEEPLWLASEIQKFVTEAKS
jgi:pimeloyl-ACP methyl ester carboxylesterase